MGMGSSWRSAGTGESPRAAFEFSLGGKLIFGGLLVQAPGHLCYFSAILSPSLFRDDSLTQLCCGPKVTEGPEDS